MTDYDYNAVSKYNKLPDAEAAEQRIELLRAQVGLLRCPTCNKNVDPDVIPTENGNVITYKAVCPDCGVYIKWLPKSIFEGVKKANGKRRKAAWTADKLEIDYCEICGRPKAHLGANEKLESHHKMPVEHGGEDIPENILILCTPCHRMVHFLRTYLNNHLAHLYEDDAGQLYACKQ